MSIFSYCWLPYRNRQELHEIWSVENGIAATHGGPCNSSVTDCCENLDVIGRQASR